MSYSFVLRIVPSLSRLSFVEMLNRACVEKSLILSETEAGKDWSFGDIAVGENSDHSQLTVYVAAGGKLTGEINRFLNSRPLSIAVSCVDEDGWAYNLIRGGEVVDQFATFPDIVVPFELRHSRKGSSAMLSDLWNIRIDVANRYLRWWRTPEDLTNFTEEEEDKYWERIDVTGKALDSDEYEYGNSWQMIDFVRALGAAWPPKNDGKWSQFKVRDLNGHQS